MTTVLVIDSDAALRRTLALTLPADGMRCVEAAAIAVGLRLCVAEAPDVTLLAIESEESAFAISIREIRAITSKPIILMIEQHQMAFLCHALDNGAHDYIVKPFSATDLREIIHTAIRHSDVEIELLAGRIQLDDICLDMQAQTITRSGVSLHLTREEWRLLQTFVTHSNRPLTCSFLSREVWGAASPSGTTALQCLASSLRRKIEKDPVRCRHLLVEPGVGYRFVSDHRETRV